MIDIQNLSKRKLPAINTLHICTKKHVHPIIFLERLGLAADLLTTVYSGNKTNTKNGGYVRNKTHIFIF